MSFRARALLLSALSLVVGGGAGAWASGILSLEVEPKLLLERESAMIGGAPTGSAAATASRVEAVASGTAPLPLRLVDAGAVGVPADTASWGSTYSHATHAFDELFLDGPPWVDEATFLDVRRDWEAYIERMAGWGSNGVVVEAFLELINFDRVEDGSRVYPSDSPMRARHEAARDRFGTLFRFARDRGMGVYLKTDMLALTPELERYLRASTGGLDPGDPALWEVYARGLDEVFATMPPVAGVVIRIGEAGPLFNVDGVAYRSVMALHEPAHVRTMLRSLLPVFERHGARLVFRSWSVGVGGLGDLHNDPAAYLEALEGVDSPSLVVSTKYTQGDYFGFLSPNPTLAVGSQQRLVEFQARREFEGFGAFPNYLAGLHGRALRTLLDRNPDIVGVSLWTQEGGPLKAGPISLYPLSGFWRWIDVNVYATSRLALDPSAEPRALARAWARETISDDPVVVEGLADVLLLSREATEKALYIRPYAEQRVAIAGFEVPPLLWIQEWDMVGGWAAVSSTLHRLVGDRREEAISEGFAALDLTRRMSDRMASLEPHLGGHPDYPGMRRSLAYQESLFETLAWYRAAFLGYYAWLETGEGAWRAPAVRFRRAAAVHQAEFGDDLDFPSFDFGPALRAFDRAERASAATWGARGLLALLGGLLACGLVARWRRALPRPVGDTARAFALAVAAPWRLRAGAGIGRPARVGLAAVLAGALLGALVLLLPSGSATVVGGTSAVLAAFVLALAASWRGRGTTEAWASASVAPLVPVVALVLCVLAVRGPDLFWSLVWTDDLYRTVLFAVAGAGALWSVGATTLAGERAGGLRPVAAAGSALLAVGAGLLVLGLLLPGAEEALVALDDPLAILPMTRAIVNGITVYAGVPEVARWVPVLVGAGFVAVGAVARAVDGPSATTAG